MNPLLTLWFLVAATAVVLAVVFYLAENYPYIIGNFYVLLGILIGAYCLYGLILRFSRKKDKKND